MQIREDWEKKLIQEARKLTKHGWGEMGFLAYKNEKGTQKIIINLARVGFLRLTKDKK